MPPAAGEIAPDAVTTLQHYGRRGDGSAAEVAAYLLATGQGTDKDLVQAFCWYMRAALVGRTTAIEDGVRVWRATTAPHQREAEALLLKSFTPGEIDALKDLWRTASARIPPDPPKKSKPTK